MSRSNPHEGAKNPATRWFEWNGEHGKLRYYDKSTGKNVDMGADFTFLLLDQMGSVRGWHEASSSGIYSNEVRDTRQDVLVVKSFKGGTIAEGLYKDIKDRCNTAGGQFVSNCYIAFKSGDELAIGSLRFKGAALGAWMEFCKANRAALYTKAVHINGAVEGKKGRVTYFVPAFFTKELSGDTHNIAVALDAELQQFLTSYLKQTKRDQVAGSADSAPLEPNGHPTVDAPTDDDIPF